MSLTAPDTPAATRLRTSVHERLVAEGWTQDDDSSFAEYVVLMLLNGKKEEEVIAELQGELLENAPGIPAFVQWLFQQYNQINQEQTPAKEAENTVPAAYEMDVVTGAPQNAYVLSCPSRCPLSLMFLQS